MSYEVDIGSKIKEQKGVKHLPTLGFSITGGLVISKRGMGVLGMSPKQIEVAQAVDKNKELIDADIAKAKENRDRNIANLDFQKANDEYTRDLAEITRKWGKEAGEAALK